MRGSRADAQEPHVPLRRPHPLRDNVEGILAALVLALIIRHFVFEVFKIPTGSMAPTLLGQHRDLVCPNCGLRFPVDAWQDRSGLRTVVEAVCPNCGYELPRDLVRRTFCTHFPSWPQRLFWRGGNRVIVNKIKWLIDPPRRWDVLVFRHPDVEVRCRECGKVLTGVNPEEDLRCPVCGSRRFRRRRKNLIKRLVGLPGEEIIIWHGDIFADGVLQAKPPEVQADLWQLVHDSAYAPREPVLGRGPTWIVEAGDLRREGTDLVLAPGPAGRAAIRYAREILDFVAYNGRVDYPRPPVPVGDLRWDATVKLDGPGILRLGILEDGVEHVAALGFGGAGRTAIAVGGEILAESDFSARVAAEHRVLFSNVDDRLSLRVDGREVLKATHAVPLDRLPAQGWESGADLEVQGARATFSRVRLERDIYYLPADLGGGRSTVRFRVPAGEYFMLGDNVRKSWDSRYWTHTFVPRANVIGRASVIWWPPGDLRPVF